MITDQELQEVFNKVFLEEEESHQRMVKRHSEIMEMIEKAKPQSIPGGESY